MGKYTIEGFIKRGVKVLNTAPDGWIKAKTATTAPNGYSWYGNGKSRFEDGGKDFKHALVKDLDREELN